MKKPDWKCIEDYDYIDQEDPVVWAWEFLRRNRNYRDDYEALKSGALKEPFYDPPKKENETKKEWQHRCIQSDVEPRIFPPAIYLPRKWGLKHRMRNPALNALELKAKDTSVEFEAEFRPIILKTWDQVEELPVYDSELGDVLISDDKLVAVLDLTLPIPPQIKELKKVAEKSKVKATGTMKPKATAFLQGIRALDGLDAEASPHEIGKVLFADDVANIDVKAHDCIKSAHKNAELGYRAIARRLGPIPKL